MRRLSFEVKRLKWGKENLQKTIQAGRVVRVSRSAK